MNLQALKEAVSSSNWDVVKEYLEEELAKCRIRNDNDSGEALFRNQGEIKRLKALIGLDKTVKSLIDSGTERK